MMRTILASAATIGLTAGAASADGLYYTGEAMVAPGFEETVAVERRAAVIAPEVAVETDGFVVGERAVLDEPAVIVDLEPRIDPELLIVDDEYTDGYLMSDNGLTPGAPLGGGIHDEKLVADGNTAIRLR